jgi:hypothetical protein
MDAIVVPGVMLYAFSALLATSTLVVGMRSLQRDF